MSFMDKPHDWEPNPCPQCGGVLMVMRERGTEGVVLGKTVDANDTALACPDCGACYGIVPLGIRIRKAASGATP